MLLKNTKVMGKIVLSLFGLSISAHLLTNYQILNNVKNKFSKI